MKVLKEIAIMIIAVIVFLIWFLIGVLYTFFKHLFRWDYSLNKQLAPIFKSISLLNDGMANAGAGEMMNDWFLKQKYTKLKYGNWNETISEKTGQNQIKQNLNKNGKFFRQFIDKMLGKNHCKNAIN